jgi:hypothetical protein
MLGGSGVAAVLAVLLFRLLPIIETWVRVKAGREVRHNRRESDRVPERINGNPCGLHEGLMKTLETLGEDMKEIKSDVKDVKNDLFPRVNAAEVNIARLEGRMG